MVKTLIPERENELLSNKSLTVLLELKARCEEFLGTQKGGGKKKTSPKKKSQPKKKTTFI